MPEGEGERGGERLGMHVHADRPRARALVRQRGERRRRACQGELEGRGRAVLAVRSRSLERAGTEFL